MQKAKKRSLNGTEHVSLSPSIAFAATAALAVFDMSAPTGLL